MKIRLTLAGVMLAIGLAGAAPAAGAPAVVAVGGLFGGACASLGDDVVCWGKPGTAFAVNDGSLTPAGTARPARVPGLTRVRALAAGRDGACAISVRHRLLCWGNPGALSLESSEVHDVGLGAVTSVSMSSDYGCAVHSRGKVSCWGSNLVGQLGGGARESDRDLSLVSGLPRVRRAVVGAGKSCAIAARQLWCWGANRGGVLGPRRSVVAQPVRLRGFSYVDDVAPLEGGLCARIAHRLRCIGRGGTTESAKPTRVAGIARVRALEGGGSHACVIDWARRLVCWGRRTSGQLGISSDQPPNPYLGTVPDDANPVVAAGAPVDAPVRIAGMGAVRRAALGNGGTCAITVAGRILCVGAATIAGGSIPDGQSWPRDPAYGAPFDVIEPLEVLPPLLASRPLRP